MARSSEDEDAGDRDAEPVAAQAAKAAAEARRGGRVR